MADFYIVPPRLTVGTFDRANVVNSINTLKGDLTFVADPNSGVRVLITGDVFQFSIANDFYVKKSGDTYTKNLVFRPDSGYFGLGVGYGSANPGSGNTTGALFYNTTSNLLQVFDGSTWNSVTGGVGLTETSANLLYLRLDGANTPTGNISMGSQFLRLANLTTQVIAGSTGQIFFNTSTNKINVYDGTAWVTVGLGITAITAGNGITSTFNPITAYSTISIDSSANFTWTGNHTFNNPVTFAAAGQSFAVSKLFISGQTSGDLIYFNGSNWDRFSLGNANQTLQVNTGGTGLTWGTSSGSATTAQNVYINSATRNLNHPIVFTPDSGTSSGAALSSNTTITFNAFSNILSVSGISITATTLSTNTTSGALIVSGGVGIASSVFIGGNLSVENTIVNGTWAGSTITGLYGGTGYSSYTKGDLLVGAGSTFLKLSAGTNGYVLAADSGTPAGLGWTTVTGVAITTAAPASPKNADLWFNSTDGSLSVYYQDTDTSQWVEIAVGSGIDLSQPVHITNTTSSTSMVTGALQVDGGVGIQKELNALSVGINDVYDYVGIAFTTSSTTINQVAHSLSASTYRSLKYTVQVTSSSDYNAIELLMLHDGSTVYMTEYAQILAGSGTTLSTYNADINGGNIRLLVSPTNSSTTYKLQCTAMKV